MVDFGTRFSFFEWVGRCFDGTLGHIRATLSTLISGEDETNEWISINPKGYKKIRAIKFAYAAGNAEKAADSGINVEEWDIVNQTSVNVWVAFNAASITAPADDAFPTTDMIVVPALSSVTIPFYVASGTNQVRVEPVASTTGSVYVIAKGNS